MADRPHDQAPEPGGTDYGWLYGKRAGQSGQGQSGQGQSGQGQSGQPPEPTRKVSTRRVSGDRQADTTADATQMMPTMPRPSQGQAQGQAQSQAARGSALPSPGEIAPTPGEPGGPGRSGGARNRRRWLRPRNVLIGILALIVLWVAVIAWVGIAAWNGIDKVAYEPKASTRPDDQPGTTYLIVASDSRKGLTKAERKKLHTGNAAGQRTDTIKLLHTGSGPNTLVTIPRDSIVAIPGHGTSKINAAFAWGGPKLLTRTIEADTGIKIDGYVEIGMGGLVNLVDAVGGITICPTKNMNDNLAGLHIKKGCQEADGVTALAYSRSRHTLATGDLGRGVNQDEVISQIGSKIAHLTTVINPFKVHKLADAVSSGFAVGKGMSAWGGLKFLLAFKSIGDGSAKTCGVPISDMSVNWDPTRSKKFFTYIIDDETDKLTGQLCTSTGLPKSVTG
ncbi:MAG: LCP family protein [Nocardioides sp.]|uniref:LCP family protein n=1 Tax=Nocardioides sp. TaxID=35761 RepID=UPI0039E4AF1D